MYVDHDVPNLRNLAHRDFTGRQQFSINFDTIKNTVGNILLSIYTL